MNLVSLNDVFLWQLAGLYSVEQQLVEALPDVARAADAEALRDVFEHHLDETRGHVAGLETIFGQLEVATPYETCEAMAGLIAEGSRVGQATGDPTAKDAALIAVAQRIEHYEIAGYSTARALADELSLDEAASILDRTLGEETNADRKLAHLATGGLFGAGINRETRESSWQPPAEVHPISQDVSSL